MEKMTPVLSALLIAVLFSAHAQAAPKYGKNVSLLTDDSTYLKSAAKTDFWKLIPFYVAAPSANGSASASTAMVLNALLAPEQVSNEQQNLELEDIAKFTPKFKKNIGANGKAIFIDDLATELRKYLDARYPDSYTVTVERFDGKNSKDELKRLEKLLKSNERNPRDFAIVNYLQGIFVGDRKAISGRMSPIGAFDSRKKKILVLETDRKAYQPYWVPLDKFLDGMNTSEPGTSKKRGIIVVSKN